MPTKNRFHFVIYLALLSIIGFLATDMYLPAFDQMRMDLNTSKQNIAASLTLFLGGFAIAQLLWGPISDRYGKPLAITIGLGLFTITSIGIFFTQNIVIFLILRMLQAIGGCAAAVSWQALIIDHYPENKVKNIFASIMPLVALSPALAPLLGVYILQHWGWKYIFLFLALLATILIAYTFTLKSNENPTNRKNQTAIDTISYISFFKYKNYLGNVIIYAFCSAGFFAWLTGAPFFLKELGYDEAAIGWSFVPQTIAFIIGGYGYRLISNRVDGKRILPYLLITYSISMVALLLIAVLTVPTLTLLLIPFCLMAFTNGATYPIVVTQALQPFKNNSGKASALQNTLQLGACFLASAFVSLFSKNALLATMIVMVCTVFFVAIGYRLSKKKA